MIGDAVVLPRARHAAAARPAVYRGARRGRAGKGRRPDPRILAAGVRRPRRRALARTCGSAASRTRSSACCRRTSCSSIPRSRCSARPRSPRARSPTKSRHSNNWQQFARLKPGATHRAGAEPARRDQRREHGALSAVAGDPQERPVPQRRRRLPDRTSIGERRSTLTMLWGGAIFVLLIGCVNVANLVLVRSTSRIRELATRHAMGATFGRLARQSLTESTVLLDRRRSWPASASAGGRCRRRRSSASIGCRPASVSRSTCA